MKILLVQSRPYLAFPGGDGAYTHALIRHLDESGIEVVGITSGSTKGRPRPFLKLAYPAPRLGSWRFRSTFRVGSRYVALSWQLLRDTWDFLRDRRNPAALSAFAVAPDTREQAWIDGILRRENPAMVILTFEAAGAVDLIQKHAIPLLSLVGFLPIRNYALSADADRGRQQEQKAGDFLSAIRKADKVGFSSRDDCNFARKNLEIEQPIYVGMGFTRQAVRSSGRSRTLLFVGNKTAPNREAVAWFIERAWPRIRRADPDARFRIVGRVGHYFETNIEEGIECAGEVADLSQEYCQARAVVAPLLTGSAGVKTKVAEAISYGCPLVATSLGVDGADSGQIDRAGFIADDPAQFADHAVTLLTDDAVWEEKQAGTAAVFDAIFSREAAYAELDRLIASIKASIS